METIGEKRCDHPFLRREDVVVSSISKQPNTAEVSLEDLSYQKPVYTPIPFPELLTFISIFSWRVLKISQPLNA